MNDTWPGSTGRWCRLRPVYPSDFEAIFLLAHSGRAFQSWLLRGKTMLFDEFVATVLNGPTHAQFVVIPTHTDGNDMPVGYAALTNVDLQAGVGHCSAMVDSPRCDGTPIGGEALQLLLHHAFAVVGLRKVYAETTTESVPVDLISGSPALSTIAREEGRLFGHVMMGGALRDSVIYAIYREDFESISMSQGRTTPSATQAKPDACSVVRDAIQAVSCDEGVPAGELTGGHRLGEDLGLDSLGLATVLLELDVLVGRELDSDVEVFLTVQDLVEHVERAASRASPREGR